MAQQASRLIGAVVVVGLGAVAWWLAAPAPTGSGPGAAPPSIPDQTPPATVRDPRPPAEAPDLPEVPEPALVPPPPPGPPLAPLPGPLPSDYQGARILFEVQKDVVASCLAPVVRAAQADGETLPEAAPVRFTIDAVAGEGRITGIEVAGDYSRRFTPFALCLAQRLGEVRFQAPAGQALELAHTVAVPRPE
jgi:hypothetical protein